MAIKNILLLILPIMTEIFSSYLTYLFANKSKQKEAMPRFKEEKYSNLIIALQGFIGTTMSSEKKRNSLKNKYKSWLYSSDEVTKAINEFIKLLIEERGKNLIATKEERLSAI